MPGEKFLMSLETLFFNRDPLSGGNPESAVLVWPAFFKIDGTTAHIAGGQDLGKVMGTATVSGTSGVGPTCTLVARGSTPLPAEINHWSDRVARISLPPEVGGSTAPGHFGVALLIVDPGGLESDAVVAAHAAFNDSLQSALNDMIANLPPFPMDIGPDQVDTLVAAVTDGIQHAISGALDGWRDEVHAWLDRPMFGDTFAFFSQDELPASEFDQKDFDPAGSHGPAPFRWNTALDQVGGWVGLNGAISQLRRSVGQDVLGQMTTPPRAVAGFASPDGYQHAISATDDGTLTEMYWQGPGQVASGVLTQFSHQVVGLAGYTSADGFQQVIVATDDGTVTEVYWQGGASPQQGALAHFDSGILAITGYPSGDGRQHVIVATDDGNLTEVYWLTGEPAQGTLIHLDSTVVDLAGYEADGVHHVIAASNDGTLTEITWNGTAPTARTLAVLEAQPWNHLLGVGAYQAAQEQHVIVAMSSGALREFHTAADGGQALHTDLAIAPGIVPIIDAYAGAGGDQHAIFATDDGAVHELWWSPEGSIVVNPVPPATIPLAATSH